MAKRRVKPGARSLVALILVGFVLVTTGVIARRVYGVGQQHAIRQLQQQRDALEAQRIRLEADIREASSRKRLQPIAERRLNMHIPTPDQQILLPRSTDNTILPIRRPRRLARRMIRSSRIGLTHATLALFAVAILVKAADVQLVNGRSWRARAARQQTSERVVPAPRGELLDATNRVLAESREMVRLEIAPREVNDPRASCGGALARLAVDPALIRRAVDTSSKYITIPGRFLAVDAAPAIALRGVHSFATISRAYAVSEGAQGILGHVDEDDKPVDGLELVLDSILRGTPGSATIIRDPRGQARESPITPGTPPVDGDDVVLTINADLQEIAEKSLADAVARMDAEGGDIVILDPHTGEILAMASRRLDPRQTSATVLTEPFEPGSTAKPFIAAGLIARGLVSDHDSVDTGNGVLEVKGARRRSATSISSAARRSPRCFVGRATLAS